MAIGKELTKAIAAVAKYLRLKLTISPLMYFSMNSEDVRTVIAIINVIRMRVDVRSPNALASVITGKVTMSVALPVMFTCSICMVSKAMISKTISY